MEAAFQPSVPSFRNKITTIEAMELTILGFAFWCLGAFAALGTQNTSLGDQIIFLIITEIILLGSWAIYNVHIRIARAGGRTVDIGIWIVASLLTGTYTFWAWIILDVNRLLISKLFYRGDALVEFAWSARSKKIRKAWEQARTAGSA